MRIRLAIPDNVIDGPTIDAALEAVTRGNEALAARGMLPDMGTALANGLKWKPEPWLGERFDLAPDAAARGWGDCDDLAPWLAAQLRAAGEQARAFARRSGKNKWHVQVERGDGQILDPSSWAGMPTSAKGKDLAAPQAALAVSGQSAICAVPHQGRWHVRADMPLTERIHVAGWARDPDVRRALDRAVASYAAIAEGCHGIGDATVGFGLGDIVSAVAPMAGTALGGPLGGLLASQLAPMAGGIVDSAMGSLGGLMGGLGGGGRPAPPAIAPQSGDAGGRPPPISVPGPPPNGWPSGAVTHQIPGPGGGGEARVTHSPGGGPIIVRF